MDCSAAILAHIEATMHSTLFVYGVAYTTRLARVMLLFSHNTNAFNPGFVREYRDDTIKRPSVELLVPAITPVFTISDVLKVPHDDRGNTASNSIANKRFGKAVEHVGTLTRPFLVQR
jgi:hypothetical protein